YWGKTENLSPECFAPTWTKSHCSQTAVETFHGSLYYKSTKILKDDQIQEIFNDGDGGEQ
ncbi:hypothetical protein, partial [Anabaena sp. UHCC 0253]|uniref:hypothetical protein n=1 Tax=Anabaena sp. UHCC 0253 TaxID=2590019 RepID=UPI001C2CC27C